MQQNIPPTSGGFPPSSRNVEDELLGKWFPRIGALAVVLGAGFGFKYAVDQGWVGPQLRIILGILVSSILIGIGDWTLRRDWSAYAHAITGGGVALMYLTLWAAVGMYELLPPSVGFVCLIGVSGLGCALALRHESQTLALLSVIGGFVNPFVTGASTEMPQGLYLYILTVDLAVVALSFVRPWNLLEKVAFTGSWIVLEVGSGSAAVSLLAATGIFLMFGAVPYARVLLRRGQGVTDFAMVPINGLLFYLAVFTHATGELEGVRGPLTLGLALFFLAGLLVVRRHEGDDAILTTSSGAMSFLLVTLWSPVQLGTDLMALGWAVEALALLAFGLVQRDLRIRAAGWIVLTMSLMSHLTIVVDAPVVSLNDNYGRFVFILLVAAIYMGAYLEHRDGTDDLRDASFVGANALTLLWLSLEVHSAVAYGVAVPDAQDLHFGLSGLWALYASALLAAGIYLRARNIRMISLMVFGVTLAKMALHDLWLLDTLQRLLGFVGIGVLLLACSLMYHRFEGRFTRTEMPEATVTRS
jgi:uncharacterized membrane protein